MREERLYQIIKGVHATEKAQLAIGTKQLVFKVALDATKAEIMEAFQSLFGEKPTEVNTLIVKGKSKRFGSKMGQRKNYKKAYITLDPSVDLESLQAQQG